MRYILLLLITLFNFSYGEGPIKLQVVEREITVKEKKAKVYAIMQPDGTFGLSAKKGDQFDVILENQMDIPTSVHWHGLILPNNQDGVAFITQLPIYPNTQYHYQFPLVQSGTYFMHSHFGLQEQKLLAAPLILHEPEEDKIADQEIVVLLSDFTFKSPQEIYQNLKCDCKKRMGPMKMSGSDVVEVDYDAFLVNFQTSANFEVKPGSQVRIRVINAASATNFFIESDHEVSAIAVDGNRIKPLPGKHFELGVAQRIDLLIIIPEKGGSFLFYTRGEGTNMQTGFALTSAGTQPPKIEMTTPEKAGVLKNKQEAILEAIYPLTAKEVNRRIEIKLGGDMINYVWTLNGQAWPEVTPVLVKKGERVEIVFRNVSSMTHPMHLHGHVFQITNIDGKKINGALRDTVLVMPNSTVTIQFDADNPGVWPLHCHVLYHLEAGMLTVLRYE